MIIPWPAGAPSDVRWASQLKLGTADTFSVPIEPVTSPGSQTRMSLVPCAIALEPSISSSPAFMKTLISVRRVTMPPPYELVRHSVLARLPGAPFGHRFWLPAACAAGVASATSTSPSPSAAIDLLLLCKGRPHQQTLRVALRQGVPHA